MVEEFPWNDEAQFQVKGKVIAAGIIKPGEQAQVLLEGRQTLAGEVRIVAGSAAATRHKSIVQGIG